MFTELLHGATLDLCFFCFVYLDQGLLNSPIFGLLQFTQLRHFLNQIRVWTQILDTYPKPKNVGYEKEEGFYSKCIRFFNNYSR